MTLHLQAHLSFRRRPPHGTTAREPALPAWESQATEDLILTKSGVDLIQRRFVWLCGSTRLEEYDNLLHPVSDSLASSLPTFSICNILSLLCWHSLLADWVLGGNRQHKLNSEQFVLYYSICQCSNACNIYFFKWFYGRSIYFQFRRKVDQLMWVTAAV